MAMGLSDAIVVGRYYGDPAGYHALGWALTSVVVTMAHSACSGRAGDDRAGHREGRRRETGAVLRRGIAYSLWIGLASMIGLALGGPAFLHAIGLERRPGRRVEPGLLVLLPVAAGLCAERQRQLLDGRAVAAGSRRLGHVDRQRHQPGAGPVLVPGPFGLAGAGRDPAAHAPRPGPGPSWRSSCWATSP